MGKSLIITGIEAQIAGLGNVEDKNGYWLLGVDKETFENNLEKSSFIEGVTLRYDSFFNNGVNIFENKKIIGFRCYTKGAGNLSFGIHDGSTFTSLTGILNLESGYVEKKIKPFTIPQGKYMAINLCGCSLVIKRNPIGVNYIGFSFNSTHYTDVCVLIDFKVEE